MTVKTVESVSVGEYLGERLVQAGCRHVFGVCGDYSLALLDELLKHNHTLTLINNCNELNAGYSADGYARGTGGLAVLVVTYCVGSLSAINAVAGAYSDDLPLLVICCGPSLRDMCSHRIMHHSLAEYTSFDQSARCYAPVVEKVFTAHHIDDAALYIDKAVSLCLTKRKPVYLELACDLAPLHIAPPNPLTLIVNGHSDANSLASCVEEAMILIFESTKPVIVVGPKTRGCEDAVKLLAERLGCGVAVQPNAKGLFDETHAQYIGCFWGAVSSPCCEEIVESADLVLELGTVWFDGNTVGWSTLKRTRQTIVVSRERVVVAGRQYSEVRAADLLPALSAHVPLRTASLAAFQRYCLPSPLASTPPTRPDRSDRPDLGLGRPGLTRHQLVHQIQSLLSPRSAVLVETGDCWFIGDELRLPAGATYHSQMLYGSIGWSVGATLGLALASANRRHVVAIIGDGSFQMTAQELSTLVRHQLSATIFLVNNATYGIEVALHDGPYNYLKNWRYAQLMSVFNNSPANTDKVKGLRATTKEELAAAVKQIDFYAGTVLIECCLEKDDCSAKLLKWGTKVAEADTAGLAPF